MADKNSSKKTFGRRKIEIKKIEKKSSLQVAFAKRKKSLFTKASELSLLCGADMAILVTSPANKVFGFGNPDVGSVIHRFQTGLAISPARSSHVSSSSSKYYEAVRRLEKEKSMKELYELQGMMGNNWWDRSVEGMELQELEEYLEAMEGLKNRVLKKLGEMEKTDTNSSEFGNYDDEEKGTTDEFNYGEFMKALLNQQDLDHITVQISRNRYSEKEIQLIYTQVTQNGLEGSYEEDVVNEEKNNFATSSNYIANPAGN